MKITFPRLFDEITNRTVSLREMFNKSLGRPVAGNTELDKFREDLNQIPKEWADKRLCVYFLGSVNVDEDSESFVRRLVWSGDCWYEDREYLWVEKTKDHPNTPTIDEPRYGWRDVVAVFEKLSGD